MLTPETIAAFAELGLTASVQPVFDALWGGEDGMYAQRLGPERARTLNPFAALLRTAHERLVDNPPWLWIVHDLNPRAMSRRVRGFISPQAWFVDLARVDLQ